MKKLVAFSLLGLMLMALSGLAFGAISNKNPEIKPTVFYTVNVHVVGVGNKGMKAGVVRYFKYDPITKAAIDGTFSSDKATNSNGYVSLIIPKGNYYRIAAYKDDPNFYILSGKVDIPTLDSNRSVTIMLKDNLIG